MQVASSEAVFVVVVVVVVVVSHSDGDFENGDTQIAEGEENSV